MKQFLRILKFELKNYFQNKLFVGITLFLILAVTALMFFPRIESYVENSDSDSDTDVLPIMIIGGKNAEQIKNAFVPFFTDYDIVSVDESESNVKEAILLKEAECAFYFSDLLNYTYYVENMSMYDSNMAIANEAIQGIYRFNLLIENGISQEEAEKILSTEINAQSEILGKDQVSNYFYTYIMIFALYMVIVLYGNMITSNVAAEKSSKAMELLVTSASPVQMMFGKVMASCIAGFVQILGVFGSAILTFNINKEFWDGNDIITSFFDMPTELLVYMLIFFVLGFLIYAFMFGAVGSITTKLEDANTYVMPIMIIFVFAFFITFEAIMLNEVDTVLMKVCAYIPFTSPMAMFARIAMSSVEIYEIIISIVILIVSSLGIGYLSAKIYRIGVLLYGTPPKPSAIIKALKESYHK